MTMWPWPWQLFANDAQRPFSLSKHIHNGVKIKQNIFSTKLYLCIETKVTEINESSII